MNTMTPEVEKAFREALSAIIAEDGAPVLIDEKRRKQWPTDPDMWVSTYGWRDTDAYDHCKPKSSGYYGAAGCSWIVPEGVEVEEVAYSEFQDTFSGNEVVAGVNAYGGSKGSETEIRCACGKYRGVTLRYEATVAELLARLFNTRRTFTI